MKTRRIQDRDPPNKEKLTGRALVNTLGPASQPFHCASEYWKSQLAFDPSARRLLGRWREIHAGFAVAPLNDDLFLRHTYLAIVARFIAAAALAAAGQGMNLRTGDPRSIADGQWFQLSGVAWLNRDPDLFGWPESDVPLRGIMETVDAFDLADVQCDALKTLHHAMTAVESRRSLGELYTPDWLAEWIVDDVLRKPLDGPLLDPSCGSGTFLFFAIRRLRADLAVSPASLHAILASAHGADVNPLAIELAQANYLLALGRLLATRGEIDPPIRLPITECDALARESWDLPYAAVVGNPPWIPLRTLPQARQDTLKRLGTRVYHLADGRGEMVTHLETATLFLAHCADTALRPGGSIAFVLPRTVFTAEQHNALRTGAVMLPKSAGCRLNIERIIDCERVSPLFATPAAVLFATKQDGQSASHENRTEIPVTELAGRLPNLDVSLREARRLLVTRQATVRLHRAGGRSWWSSLSDDGGVAECTHKASPYKARFQQGATLVPRSFWFVDAEEQIALPRGRGWRIASAEPCKGGPVRAYRDYRLVGEVEETFLFKTLLGDDLLPFGARRFRTVALPILAEGARLRIVNAESLLDLGWTRMAAWVAEAERIWTEVRGDKAAKMSVTQRLDHVRGLTAQRLSTRYRVLYPNFQRSSVACVTDSNSPEAASFPPRFVTDTALYCCETEDAGEAHYLCAVLNSHVVDHALGPLRRGNQAAHPNVHKKLFDVMPIPLFDSGDALHARLSELGATCAARVRESIRMGDPIVLGNIGVARRDVRTLICDELAEIDSLTAAFIGRLTRVL